MSSLFVRKTEPVVAQIVLDFGFPEVTSFHSSIEELAECAVKNYQRHEGKLLTLAQGKTYKVLRKREDIDKCMCITVSQSDTMGLDRGGTYHVLERANELLLDLYMTSTGDPLPYPYRVELVAHKAHVWRARQQGWLFGLDMRPIDDLPTEFYACAKQWWCRSKWLWQLREAAGYIPLKLAGQL